MSLEQLEPETMGAETHGLPRGQTWDKGSKGGSMLSVGHHPQEGGREGGRWGPGVVTGSKAPRPPACDTLSSVGGHTAGGAEGTGQWRASLRYQWVAAFRDHS